MARPNGQHDSTMKLLIVVSESHRPLYEGWFLPGLPEGVYPEVLWIGEKGDGHYESEGWREGVMAKLTWVLRFCHACPGETFVLSDVDIQFFAPFSFEGLEKLLVESRRDILFQKESSRPDRAEVNTGFYIGRATPWVVSLLEEAVAQSRGSADRNDQSLVNSVLLEKADPLNWGHLPAVFYARSHGFPPPRGILLHHANMTASVADKIAQLQRVRRWAEGGAAHRLSAVLGEFLHYLKEGKLGSMLGRKAGGLVRPQVDTQGKRHE